MNVAVRQLFGREEERGAVAHLLDEPEQLPAAAVLWGEAGIGKTTLWLAGIEAASARGYRVLSARPSAAETRFSFAGLADLLGAAAGEVVSGLPPVQRRALEAALLLGESEVPADERVVAAAFLGAVRLLAADGPLCLAVDDVQWLDAASLAALRYALARLEDEQLAALIAVRGDVPDWLRRAVPEQRRQTIHVGGLSVGAIHELLRVRLDATFARPTLLRIWETAGGNPFFALELAAALQRRGGTLAPGEQLPISSDLDRLLQDRLDGLSPAALDVARAVAALADPTVLLVEAAAGRRGRSGLSETLAARILELDGERLRFTHPLLGTAVSRGETPARRRSLHARLAQLVPTAEERARHLALATAEPGLEISAILEEAARSAHSRGAPTSAAELAEQALRLTPTAAPADSRRRLFLAADLHHTAGDTARATVLLTRARAEAAPGVERAAVLAQLAAVQPEPREAQALYQQALAEAEGDDALEATIHLRLAALMRWGEGVSRGAAHADLAVQAASRTDDVALRCRALAFHADWQLRDGRGLRRSEMDEAVELELGLPERPLRNGPTMVLCHQLVWTVDLDAARRLLLELRALLQLRSDARGEASALWWLAFLEWRAGNWDQAERYGASSLELSTQLGDMNTAPDFPAAVIAAHRGRLVEARAWAHAAIARGEAEGIQIEESGHSWVLGFVDLSLGDPNAALPQLRRAYETRNAFMLEPAQRLELGDLLEALIAVGELGEAGEVLAVWQERADALDRAWALAVLARCRALLLAATGNLESAFATFERALSEHDRSADPFQHARTLLALGRTQRRAKKRGAARTTLEDARARFERLGAPLWVEQTRAELARIGGRAPSRGELTEGEHRIAQLVAEGRTNREVAAALFLTEHSVATALTRVYRKLGVRSRAELARLFAERG